MIEEFFKPTFGVFYRAKINIGKGISGTGNVFGAAVEKLPDRPVMLEPGDYAKTASIPDDDTDVASLEVKSTVQAEIQRIINAPTAYDLWYLQHIYCMLMPEYDAIPQAYLDGPLEFMTEKLGGIKPMCFIRDIETFVDPIYSSDVPISGQWLSMREYFIHMMPYEVWSVQLTATYPSNGPDPQHGFEQNDAVGYLAFPVGQIGVHEVISLFGQSDTEADDFNFDAEMQPVVESESDFFFAPVDGTTGKNICFGRHIIEFGYVVPQDQAKSVEWIGADRYPLEAYLDAAPQMWMRYWFQKDDVFPTPGEFVGVLCKPLGLPPHIWWFQETSPFLYAGNWFETMNLTGGVVVEVVLEEDREDDGIGSHYKVAIQGREVWANSSDFLEYAVNDRVGVLKVQSLTESHQSESFKWLGQTRLLESDEGREYDSTEYVLIPIAFYEEK